MYRFGLYSFQNQGVRCTIHFPSKDLRIFRDLTGINPFENQSNWNLCQITEENFTVRGLREHVEHLLELFIEED